MGIAPERLKRFAGGYGRDLQGVERLFEESEGGLVGEIVNAKIDPIGLFRGKPFFFALLFEGFHARKTKSRNPWEIQSNWIPHSVPPRRRGRVERIPTASFESGTRRRSLFSRLKGLDASFENTPVPRQHGDLASPHPGFDRAADDGWAGGMGTGTQNPLQIPLF